METLARNSFNWNILLSPYWTYICSAKGNLFGLVRKILSDVNCVCCKLQLFLLRYQLGKKNSRMDQVKCVEDNLWKIWWSMICLKQRTQRSVLSRWSLALLDVELAWNWRNWMVFFPRGEYGELAIKKSE